MKRIKELPEFSRPREKLKERGVIVKESVKVTDAKDILPLLNDIVNKQQEHEEGLIH